MLKRYKFFRCILIFAFFMLINSFGFSQNMKAMEFVNQDIQDILMALASVSGKSIITDDTVTGKASFYFAESDFDDSLQNFLETYKLYLKTENGVIKISRISCNFNSTNSLVSLYADNVNVESLLKALSKEIGKTILYDTLPSVSLSVAIDNLPVESVLDICIKKLSDYSLESYENYYYIKRIEQTSGSSKKRNSKVIVHTGDLYSINIEKERFLDIITQLFAEAKLEYSLFVQNDMQLSNLYFVDKDFNTILSLILEQANADYVVKNNIYYIIDLQKKGVGGKIRKTDIISLTWIQAADVLSLLPSDLSSASVIKVDKNNNTLILTGTTEEIDPIKNFIKQIDIQSNVLDFRCIEIKHLKASEIVSMIPAKLMQSTPVQIPNTNSLLLSGSKESLDAVEKFIISVDVKKNVIPVYLKYIKKEDLMSNLPPSISEGDIINSVYPNLLFYSGSEENYEIFQEQLKLIDRPHPQIKYQILVIQYDKGKSLSLKPTHNITQETSDATSYIIGASLNNIMSLSFDIISSFGVKFAESLNVQIGTEDANVFTDTTLTALSGQDVNFQNTDTYRYIEPGYDNSSSGSTIRTSSTQSITSGLIVNLNGWISGDDMITMSVDATVSKQNSAASSSGSSLTTLPSTSERVVSTQVRTKSGEPVVISGLIKEDIIVTENKIPVLGYIPLLGKLFTSTSDSKKKTEIVIYIIPHLIQEDYGTSTDDMNIERYYSNFIEGGK